MSFEEGDLLILTQRDMSSILEGRETDILHWVREAYLAHHRQETSLPHSIFLRFPEQPKNRIIGLPAYLGGDFGVAGMKWIASFPGNLARGLERASAVLVLNSMETGRPLAVLESGLISARRTAASAALAGHHLHGRKDPAVGLVGSGRINFEITRFLARLFPQARSWLVLDLDSSRARQFSGRCRRELDLEVEVADGLDRLLASCDLISFATTAVEPHVSSLRSCPAGATVLHVSLRDLTPEAILEADHVVDDLDHVCRAQTSIHLTEQEIGHRDFVRAELGAVLAGEERPRRSSDEVTVFSPFGLGILDLALAWQAFQAGLEQGLGTRVPHFLEAGTVV